jgi:16S rRNA (guanine527-N7)-methyltransferase
MDPTRIQELLDPFLFPRAAGQKDPANDQRPTANDALSPTQLQNISTYIDLLIRWNARINLTAIRDPEEIVTRHFGESLFAARQLFPQANDPQPTANDLIDIGSGPGFPGIPIKIWTPQIHLTLIESNQKKAAFLREVVRILTLTDVDVFAGRAEDFPSPADVVTLRAVERFDEILPVATSLVAPNGRLALLLGTAQVALARDRATNFHWSPPSPIPLASTRTLLIGKSPNGEAVFSIPH